MRLRAVTGTGRSDTSSNTPMMDFSLESEERETTAAAAHKGSRMGTRERASLDLLGRGRDGVE